MMKLSFAILQLVCRITYICPPTKTVGLSNLGHLVDGEAMSFSSHSIGDINEETIVTRLDQSKGLLLELTEELSGYAHVSIGIQSDYLFPCDVCDFCLSQFSTP